MTYQQIIWAINDAALAAAESAWDAFGNDPSATIPAPDVAWDFLNTLYDDGALDRPRALPEFRTRQFDQDYNRHIRQFAQTATQRVSSVR